VTLTPLKFATTNPWKFREVSMALAASSIPLEHLEVGYPELQADTLTEVVSFGLDWLAQRYPDGLLLDDSGLFIHGLRGFPGVYSSYVFRTLGLQGTLRLLQGRRDRRAHFEAVFGVLLDGERHIVTGRCDGTIAEAPRGQGGFGFDPIFLPEGGERTFAEMGVEEKNGVSHRGRAAEALVKLLRRA
jgi:XTP/dITP diphosphohydrolase